MRIFLTGATGFIGSQIVPELIGAGHTVSGMTRSEAGAKQLKAAGAEVVRADLSELETLQSAASSADGVIHTAFNHDFSKFAENCETDRRVIEALGSALVGSHRPIVITSGTGIANTQPGKAAEENDPVVSSTMIPRAASEEAARALVAQGVNVSIVRLPQVHDTLKAGLVTYAIPIAREKGVSAYVGDGTNRWPAAHVSDVARLYLMALEKAEPGAVYNAVDEEGVAMKDIAEVLGRGLKVPVVSMTPEEAQAHFGWLAVFAARDLPARSEKTKKKLGWKPIGPGMLADLEQMKWV
jgi:nucleoside-diphosphate-sugar epimerase